MYHSCFVSVSSTSCLGIGHISLIRIVLGTSQTPVSVQTAKHTASLSLIWWCQLTLDLLHHGTKPPTLCCFCNCSEQNTRCYLSAGWSFTLALTILLVLENFLQSKGQSYSVSFLNHAPPLNSMLVSCHQLPNKYFQWDAYKVAILQSNRTIICSSLSPPTYISLGFMCSQHNPTFNLGHGAFMKILWMLLFQELF